MSRRLSDSAALRHVARDCGIIVRTLEAIDNRCLAADGPVTRTLDEATDKELRCIYLAAKRVVKQWNSNR